MAEAAQALLDLDQKTVSRNCTPAAAHRARERVISCYESLNELAIQHRVGQIAAVRWLDDNDKPQWYIVVVVGQTPTGYEVRWKDDIYKVDVKRDECLLNYTQRTYAFLQRYPQATSITVKNDVYLFAFADETIKECIKAINLLRAQRGDQKVHIEGVGENVTLEQVARLVPDNKIIFT